MLVLDEELSPEEQEEFLAEYDQNSRDYDWLLRATKRDVIRRLFLEPADTTYITARWHFFMQMRFEFYWSAFHAIEKYLKAIILFNNGDTRKINHDIKKAYKKVREIVGSKLLPTHFPTILLDTISHITSMNDTSYLRHNGSEQFIDHVYESGGPNSRYAMKSATIFASDLYCFDLTVFLLRRLAEDITLKENRTLLEENPGQCPSRNAFLERVCSKPDSDLFEVMSRVNYFLIPKPDTSKYLNMGLGFAFSNNALYNNIVENAESDDLIRQEISRDVSKWAIENISLNKDYESELTAFSQ